MSEIKYRAAVGTTADVVAGDYCDVGVYETGITGYKDADGDDGPYAAPVYEMTGPVAMPTLDLDVRIDDPDALARAGDAADQILARGGWVRIEDWAIGTDAMYADVERTATTAGE